MERDLAGATLLTLGGRVAAGSGVLPPGTVVAGYRIEARAGVGGMGVVYRATDLDLDRAVALKVIAPEFATDERFRELFIAESRRAAALEHPNIIPIYRSGDEDGLLYIAMRYVEGASLQEMITRRGRLTVGAAVRIVEQIADALDHAHAHGLVHRDVKPGNVLIATRSGAPHVYLTDFGLAVPIADTASGSHGRYAGTPAYLSPEQIRDEPVDGRTDVYSLGCVLFHALTGRVPFTGPGFEAKVVSHLTERPPAVTTVVEGLPARLDDVIRRAMAKRPEDRYRSAGDLADAARDARADVVVCHHPDDAGVARSICDRLVTRGVEARTVVPDAEVDLWSAHGCLLVIGEHDLAEWAGDLLAKTSDITAHDPGYTVTSVLAPGAPDPFAPSLAPLAGRPFVDLRGGLDDPDAAADLLRTVGRPDRDPPHASSDTPPYRGLEAFQEDDAALFFGRDHEVAALTEKLRTGRFLAVLGASGSGKSSLVRAGLLPTLRGDRATVVALLTPGARPLAALAAALESTLGASAPTADELLDDTRALDRAAHAVRQREEPGRLVVVVDQFEETFSLGPNADEQRAFIDNLVFAATIPGGPTTVVLAMRSDFYHRSADHVALRALIAERQLLVGPLGPDGLRQAIEEPARACGLELERGLVRRILSDVSEEPGALPLMEHLLLELWERRRGRLLTLEGYAAAGGVSGALAQHADDAYQRLGPDERAIARRALLRLTQPGEGTEDTRRRAPISEIATSEEDQPAVRKVVEHLVGARLLVLSTNETSDEPAAEVTHEALIRGWPRLRGWIDADRESLRLHRRLTEAAHEWTVSGRDDSGLYRGTRLAAWMDSDEDPLNERERAFLQASRSREARERTSRRRRAQMMIGAAGVAAALVAGGVGIALTQLSNARDERANARSRQLASNSVVSRVPDPEQAVLLAVEARRAADTPQSEEALRQAVAESRIRGAVPDTGVVLIGLADLGNGKVLLAGEDNKLRVWDSLNDPRGQKVATREPGPGGINSVVVTRKGYLSAGSGGAIALWPSSGGPPRVVANPKGDVWDLKLINGSGAVLSSGTTGVWRWDLETGIGKRLLTGSYLAAVPLDNAGALAVQDENLDFFEVRSGVPRRRGSARSLALSPDGRRLAVGTNDSLQIWAVGPSLELLSSRLVTDGANWIAFNARGDLVAIAGGNATVTVFPTDAGAALTRLRGHSGPVAVVSFMAGDRLVSAGTDRTVRSWDWSHGLPQKLSVPDLPPNGALGLAADGATLVDISGATWTWTRGEAPRRQLPELSGRVAAAAVSRDRTRVAAAFDSGRIVARSATDETVGSWSVPDLPTSLAFDHEGSRLIVSVLNGTTVELPFGAETQATVAKHNTAALTAAYSPSGAIAVSGFRDGVILVTEGSTTTRLGSHDGPVFSAEFSPDNRYLATASGDRTIRVWDVQAKTLLRTLRGHDGQVWGVRFTADGDRVVSVGDDAVRVWDRDQATLLWTLDVPGGATQVAVDGDAPTIMFAGRRAGALVSTCDVCGSLQDVEELVPVRTSRDIRSDERAG